MKEIQIKISSRSHIDVYKRLMAGEKLYPITRYSRSNYINKVGTFINENGGTIKLRNRWSITWNIPEWLEWGNDSSRKPLSGCWVQLKNGYTLNLK